MSAYEGLSRAQKRVLQQQEKDLVEILDLPAGRRVLMRLIDSTGVFSRSFTGNSETFHREGRRSVGLDLIEEIERISPGAFTGLQIEALKMRSRIEEQQERQQDAD